MNALSQEVLALIARDTETEAKLTGDRLVAATNANYKILVYLIDKIDRLEEKYCHESRD